MTPTDVLVGILAVVVAVVLRQYMKPRQALPFPPGPKGLPVIGNLLDLDPAVPPQQLYAKWAREYASDVIHLKVLNSHIVVVNTFEAAFELFDRRSSIYSDRPIMHMIHDLVQLNWFSAMMHYGDTWRAHRRFMHKYFHPKDQTDFEKKQLKSTHELLVNLVKLPQDSWGHVRLMMGSLLLNITYGVSPDSADHPWIQMAETTIGVAAKAGAPGAFLVDTFPLLKYVPAWFPGAGFQKQAKEWNTIVNATAEEPFAFIKEQVKLGVNESVVATALRAMDDRKDNSADEEILKGVAAIVYAAGADTTISVINAAILGLLLNPEIQKKAQAEADKVLGTSLPEFSDLDSLPYLKAVVKEALRWRVAAPLAIPHRLMEDDVYNDMLLPAGAVVVGNSWSMMMNEKTWIEPTKFSPERFLTPDGQIDPKVRNPEDAAFGFGRRSCPGKALAMSAATILLASVVASLDITPLIDENGKPILPNPDIEYTPGLVSSPLPFKCNFTPRSPRHLELINEAAATHA